MPTLYTPLPKTYRISARYEAQPTNPPQVFDHLLQGRSSTHIEFEHAVNRAYILNRFSTGACI